MILYITTLISRIFRISTQISDQDFKKIVTLVQKRTLPFVTTAQPSVPNDCVHHLRRHQWYHQKQLSLKYKQKLWVDEVGLEVYVKEKHNLPEIIIFS